MYIFFQNYLFYSGYLAYCNPETFLLKLMGNHPNLAGFVFVGAKPDRAICQESSMKNNELSMQRLNIFLIRKTYMN